MTTATLNLDKTLAALKAAESEKKLSPSAAANIRKWLAEPHYSEYAAIVAKHIDEAQWKDLDDAFWTVIPFGTAGRRGKMYPIGTNAINDRTMAESVQGLADYVLQFNRTAPKPAALRCAVAYDTRHRSREFAELAAGIMVANGFEVNFFDQIRPTPELSFAVRDLGCACGMMISASHNPPSDNAIKPFWSTGGQLKMPHDEATIRCVEKVTTIKRTPFAEAVRSGKVKFCQEQIDLRYRAAVLAQGQPGPRDLKILYSPLHGVGLTSVLPILQSDGFKQVEVYQPHSTPDGDFPNVPDHIANPENPKVFDAPIEHAKKSGAEIVLASDPDADRIGCAAPLTTGGSEWRTFSGNQIGVLCGELLFRRRQAAGKLTPEHYVIKTLVTSDMICRVAEKFGCSYYGDVLTGFKWIGSVMDEVGPDKFVFGYEEAHGYLAGTYARDKDGAVAALLMAELAAECKAQGITLHEHLDKVYLRYGCHLEKTINITLPGASGVAQMKAIMEKLRNSPPQTLGGLIVAQVRDYLHQQVLSTTAGWLPFEHVKTNTGKAAAGTKIAAVPKSDLLIFDLDPAGNRAAVRPSGTEPKIKFYLFASETPEGSKDLAATKKRLTERLAALEADLLAAAK